MKKFLIISSVVIVIFLILAIAYGADFSGKEKITTDKYYTWGITSEKISTYISEGEIFTEVKLIFKNITNIKDDPNDVLYVHLVDEPPIGTISNTDIDPNSNFFEPKESSIESIRREIAIAKNKGGFSKALYPPYKDTKVGTEDLVYILSQIDDPNSWTWRVFEKPFNFQVDPNNTVEFSSSLLEFIDFAGNGGTIGFGFEPTGENGFTFEEVDVELTIERYEGQYEKRVVIIRISSPPVIIG